jgi:hypothetical protein
MSPNMMSPFEISVGRPTVYACHSSHKEYLYVVTAVPG